MNRYISSRNRNDIVTAHQAIIKGLSNDGGLYTIDEIKAHIDPSEVLHQSYQQTAERILSIMLDDFTAEEMHACVMGAYDEKFDTPQIVPLTKINDGWLMELWHGPTCAFKDIALTILPRLLTTSTKKDNKQEIISILTATSGDTGKAALEGFKDVPGTAITVFYPEVGVSNIQKKQMATTGGNNVEVIAVKGNFDDCQRMVKQAASDPLVLASLDGVSISSANSINVGRLMPQIVYYYTSYAKLVESGDIACGDKVNFVVPTGNFGDILAGYFAKQLGLPVNRLICASNTNNVLTDFLNTGVYSIHRDFTPTISPSMDILISSNLERLLFMASGYDDAFVSEMMKKLSTEGSYTVPENIMAVIRETFSGYWTDEDTCRKTIGDLFRNEHVLIDPHTAVALAAKKKHEEETGDHTPSIILSTASPYKFTHDVLACIDGEDIQDDFVAMERLHELSGVKVPPSLAALKDMDIRFTRSIEISSGMQVIAERMKVIGNVHD